MNLFQRSSVLAGRSCLLIVLFDFVCLGVVKGGGRVVVEWSIMRMFINFRFPVVLDELSLLFSVVVLIISFFVMLFSTCYIRHELYLSRFIWLVMLFVVSINFLVFVPNLVGVIVGWDGLGLISFLLVIYYQNKKSLGAGMVTAFINRVGDVFLLLGVALLSSCGH